MIIGLSSVVIAVKDIDDALKVYADLFGLHPGTEGVIERPGAGVNSVLLPLGGKTFIEFIQPTVDADHPAGDVARFMERRGEGLHHLVLLVDNLSEEVQRLRSKGIQVRESQQLRDMSGQLGEIAAIHPRSTKGVFIVLVQKVER